VELGVGNRTGKSAQANPPRKGRGA
jgi:hypothetical protein